MAVIRSLLFVRIVFKICLRLSEVVRVESVSPNTLSLSPIRLLALHNHNEWPIVCLITRRPILNAQLIITSYGFKQRLPCLAIVYSGQDKVVRKDDVCSTLVPPQQRKLKPFSVKNSSAKLAAS